MSAEKTFVGLPKWAQGLIAVAVVGGIGISAYLIYKKIKDAAARRDSKKEVEDINADLNAEIKAGKKLTIKPSEISGIANNLKTAFDGYGTDYSSILKNLAKVNNQLDLLAVIKSYGVRKINSGRGNPASDFEGTLGQALAEELSSAELNAVNLMLAKKGIKQRF